jgi:hypothetical protein
MATATNVRSFNARATLIMESADNKSYTVITLSSPTIAGSSFTGTVMGSSTFTDAQYADYMKKLWGV